MGHENGSEKNGKKYKLIAIILFLSLLFGLLFLGFSYATNSFIFKPEVKNNPMDIEIQETVVELGEFIVNIKSENNSKRYLKTAVAVGCVEKKDAQRITEKMVQVRDLVIITLRSKSLDQLMIGQEDKVKKEIADNINTLFKPNLSINVYFTDYIIQ
ncbi:MAG: flagellar basal body-associated FliL family protein [Peptostreptococcales bacterium]